MIVSAAVGREKAAAHMILRAALAGRRPLPFRIRYWDGTGEDIGEGSPAFTVVLAHPGALRQALLPPTPLRLGEAFISGAIGVEGDIPAAIGQLSGSADSGGIAWRYLRLLPTLLTLPPVSAAGERRDTLPGSKHGRNRDHAAVSDHYDLSNAFYRLWLDRRMIYSCASYGTGAVGLEAAQEAKLSLVCSKLELVPGDRLLDLGCGWGGLAVYAAQRFGVEVVGVTLSREQAAYAGEQVRAAGLSSRVHIEVMDYRDVGALGAFDKAASIEMYEHVGRAQLSVYFTRLHRSLKQGGRLLFQGNTTGRESPRALFPPFISQRRLLDRYLLPDAEIVPLQHLFRCAMKAGFAAEGTADLTSDAALTAGAWLTRLEEHGAAAMQLVGTQRYNAYRLLLAGLASHFQRGLLGVHQVLLRKGTSLPDLRGPW